MTIQEYKILLPVTYNDGSLVLPDVMDAIKAEALKFFGGYSINETWTNGAWTNDQGKVFMDNTVTLYVACDDKYKVRQFAGLIKDTLQQEAVYVCKVGEVTFI